MLKTSLIAMAIATGLAGAVAAQAQTNTTDGASRAGSNAGASSLTPARTPAPKAHRTPKPAKAASHRLPANATGVGSQAANTTGPTSNSH